MGKVMKPVEFKALLNWILSEYETNRSIFGISESNFYHKRGKAGYELAGEKYETLLGPAAGPHTQCAQNIISAYLAGARFFEIKTVQIMDELDIEKPCIEAEYEGYNTEWSTELTVEEAYGEYVKAWLIMHFLKEFLELSEQSGSGFIFNMSVGYDLKGIKSEKIDSFINNLKDAKEEPFFRQCLKELEERTAKIWQIPSKISNSITLSTMHGCPPEDQEAICRYLVGEKKLHTFLKLNPTLLGYEYVNSSLRKLGFEMELKEETFAHDLQYEAAEKIITALLDYAEKQGQIFGVKLSNTLPVRNTRNILPGEEMYMSGRALFPLTINLAKKINSDFGDRLMISYCGGADYDNIREIAECGIRPVTMATNLLKPGGYSRIWQLSKILQKADTPEYIDVERLSKLADKALKVDYGYDKFSKSIKNEKDLPLYDCVSAGCMSGCPIAQEIPEYIRLVLAGEYSQALAVIHRRNALPHITGYICEQPCRMKCTRVDYEYPLSIRELKKVAALQGYDNYLQTITAKETAGIKAAVIGAGPSGLAAALFLRRQGLQVTVYEKAAAAGGLVRQVIPGFRLPQEVIDKDIEMITRSGVEIVFNAEAGVDELQKQGNKYIILAIGAGKSRELKLEGESEKVINALDFLRKYKRDEIELTSGSRIVVTGGGNSAMDSARAAVRLAGVQSVTLVYRRTEKEMPADREEFENAIQDGVVFRELLQPIRYENSELSCQPMRLGEIDASGRRKAIADEEELENIPADLVISAIGEIVDQEYLSDSGISAGGDCQTNLENVYLIGDAMRGPSSVVQAMADGIMTAEMILKKEKIDLQQQKKIYSEREIEVEIAKLLAQKGVIKPLEENPEDEADRCLKCDYICNKCTEVCPNRANIAIRVRSKHLRDHYQIIHIDKLCNECGNCETFCPYAGKPYKDKFTLFSNERDFKESSASGVYFRETHKGLVRYLKEEGEFCDTDGFLVEDNAGKEIFLSPELVDIIRAVGSNYNYLLEL